MSNTTFMRSPRDASPMNSFTCSLRQARAAIAHHLHARLVAKVRNGDALAAGHLDERVRRFGGHLAAVELEGDGGHVGFTPSFTIGVTAARRHAPTDTSPRALPPGSPW